MRRSRRQRCTSAFAIAALIATTAIASARPSPGDGPDAADLAAYREAVKSGTAAFRDGRFEEARAAFERAYAMHPDPVLLFNIASSWRRAGDTAEAVVAYRRFLAEAPADDPRRPLAEETVKGLEAQLAPPPPSEPGPPFEEPVSAPPAIERAPERRGSVLRPIGIGVTVVGGAGLVAAGIEAFRAWSFERDLETLPPGSAWNGGEAEQYRQGESSARRAVLFGAAGGAVIAAGVTLYMLGRGKGREVQISTTGTGIRVSGRF